MDKIKFIALHTMLGNTTILNVENIESMIHGIVYDENNKVQDVTIVSMRSRDTWKVVESQDEIFELINATEDENK